MLLSFIKLSMPLHSICLQVAVEKDDVLEAGDLVVFVEAEEPAPAQV